MFNLDATTAETYLRQSGRIDAGESVTVRELTGGVSNVVLLIERTSPGALGSPSLPARFVIKQSRPQLRVPQPWFCSVERNWREVEVLDECYRALVGHPAGDTNVCVPKLLFSDRENFLFAMTAAPADHVTWKQRLLAGSVEMDIVAACGRTLGRLHAATWRNGDVAGRLGDRSLFEALRIDPYYQAITTVYCHLQREIEQLIESVATHSLCLVHADFSPKNVLVYETGERTELLLIDFETGHYGDPAFDLGFFTSHLVLKAFYHAPGHEPFAQLLDMFWASYRPVLATVAEANELADLEQRAARNLAGCLLARLDGKSRVEYLTDNAKRAAVRALATDLLTARQTGWSESWSKYVATQ
jgi:5-methylthioribose kinase